MKCTQILEGRERVSQKVSWEEHSRHENGEWKGPGVQGTSGAWWSQGRARGKSTR